MHETHDNKKHIHIKGRILNANEAQAVENRELFRKDKVVAVNIMASPGAGKTTLILAILKELKKAKKNAAVIEGDLASSIDTDKIKRAGWKAIQINTGGGCHLTAQMIAKAYDNLKDAGFLKGASKKSGGVLFIENIGNLVCPADFDLGESISLVIASVPEGDDKPIKYPSMFKKADLVVISKFDLIDHFDFDLKRFEKGLRVVNAKAKIIPVSAKNGEGIANLVKRLAR
jgi:hydrogenase nickel incorporation protein HypB